MTYVIPAYESLIDGLEELRPYCSSNGCLGAFEEGKIIILPLSAL